MARVLLLDDNPDWRQDTVQILEDAGHVARAIARRDELLAALAEGWDVLLLDQRLRGDAGPDDGLDEIASATVLGTRVIVVTGFGTVDAATRAFAAGAWDYLEKRALVYPLLLRKVAQIAETQRAWGMSAMDAAAREAELRRALDRTATAPTAKGRGDALERFTALLASSIPGFVIRGNPRTSDEEFDLAVRNASSDPSWAKFGRTVLFECKNRRDPTDPTDFDRFHQKMSRRYGQCDLGFLVSLSGFTEGVRSHADAERKGSRLVVLVDRVDLAALLESADRDEQWKRLVDRSLSGS